MKLIRIHSVLVLFVITTMGCTKLEEKLNDKASNSDFVGNLTPSDIDGLLKSCYTSFRGPYQDQTGIFCLQDMSSDDCIGPTRGGDWDDNGVWRVLHTHTWDAENARIRDNFNNLLQIVFNTTNLLTFKPNKSIAAQAKMLRAYAMFTVLDLYDQVPVRQPGEDLLLPSKVLKGNDALNLIIADLNAAMPDLEDGPSYKANKWAAKTLLMKCYLNKGVYANRSNPTFDAADMDKVISLGNEIKASTKFQLENYFYKSFAPDNDMSKEMIFSNENTSTEAGNVRFHWHCGTHYNQNPGGWNGFTTLAEFYDKFDSTDQRRGLKETNYNFTPKTGMRVGLLVGQQFDSSGKKLKDRSGNDMVFTREVSPIVTTNIENAGIRVVKYVPDMKSDFSGDKDVASNDYVFLRYSDVLLMIAEASLRKGLNAPALTEVNALRAKRGAKALTAITADILFDERGREFYWESWRRNDMVRFGKFLLPYGPTKPGTDDKKYLLFPIPTNALAVNPNLKQNPGY